MIYANLYILANWDINSFANKLFYAKKFTNSINNLIKTENMILNFAWIFQENVFKDTLFNFSWIYISVDFLKFSCVYEMNKIEIKIFEEQNYVS